GFYVCQYIPDHFLFNSDSSGKKFFSCIFCIGKWSGKDTDASVVSKIIAVKDNVCSVWIFKSFLRFNGIAQDIAVYHTVGKASKEFIEVCGQYRTAVFHEIGRAHV